MNTEGRRVEDALQNCRRARRALELAIAETDDTDPRLALGRAALKLQEAIHEIETARRRAMGAG